MRKKNYKGRCEKKTIDKCKTVCKTYDPIQSAYVYILDDRNDVAEINHALYTALLLSGKLTTHLEEIDRVASKMYDRLVEQLKQRDGNTVELKVLTQTEWVQCMNTIRKEAETVVMGELIYE